MTQLDLNGYKFNLWNVYQILPNRDKLDPIYLSKGIRQGDPLFLYIFILCLEYLCQMINYKC